MDDAFPSQEIIDEFLLDPGPVTSLQLDWRQPSIVKFVVSFLRNPHMIQSQIVYYRKIVANSQKMMSKTLQWDEIYSFQKMLPLLTRWQLHHYAENSKEQPAQGVIQPDYIKKKRTPKGIPSYEIVWADEKGHFKHLIPEDQLKTFYKTECKDSDPMNGNQRLWSTIEPMDLVERVYPELVESYVKSKERPKTVKTRKNKNTEDADGEPKAVRKTTRTKKLKENVEPPENDLGTVEAIPKKRAKKLPKKTLPSTKLTTLDRFLVQQSTNPMPYQSPKIRTTTQPMNLSAFSVDLNGTHGSCSLDLSQIIDDMVANAPTSTEFHGKQLKYDDIATTPKARVEQADVVSDDESDDLDQIVARGHRKSIFDRVKRAVQSSKTVDAKLMCSTPLALPKADLIDNECCLTPVSAQSTHGLKKSMIVCSFFGANDDDGDVDLFEKSVDFRNMNNNDMDSDTENSEADASKCSSDVAGAIASDGNDCDDDNNDENDTFDRLVGAGKLK